MFAFVGYIVHANGIKFPWAMQMDGTPFPDANGNPPALWDSVSDDAKWQIFGLIAFLEFWSELSTPNHKVRYCEELSLFIDTSCTFILTFPSLYSHTVFLATIALHGWRKTR